MLLETSAAETEAPVEAKPAGSVREGSLKPVLDILPESVYDNPTWKGMAYFARDLAMYAALITGLILVSNVFADLALDAAAAVVGVGLFVIGHDAAHGALFKSKRLNSVVGHIAMLPGWHVYEGWILGHNRIHHAFTVRQGYDFVWHPSTPEEYQAMSRFKRAVHRLEWSWIGAGVYYTHQVWWTKMVVGRPPARWRVAIRRDRFIVLGYVLLSVAGLAWLGAATTGTVGGTVWLLARVVLIPWIGLMYVFGSFVHVHHVSPEIRWWKKAEWTKFKAQMEGTTVLRAPMGTNFFIHWIMVHVPHHVDMRIPMYNLEAAAAEIEKAFPGTVHEGPLRFRDYVSNTRQCKLYDFDAGRWLTYAEASCEVPPAA
ncbi:MAG: fatty acid desaturase [Acidimicrobiales bacterium]|jgi:omega-6 fatty acid desaturase (delta-12 desaturase)